MMTDRAMIDWAKPIETVPCERNPEPVPCRVVSGPDEDWDCRVEIMGKWLDADGATEGGDGLGWYCKPDGRFIDLDGSVRNVVTATATCPVCDDTGSKDYAGFAMDPCDHKPVVSDQPKTLRDEFAMAALAAAARDGLADITARHAYQLADAMMAERRKGEGRE